MQEKQKQYSAGAVVCDKLDPAAKIVIYLRKKTNKWCLPKGKIEPGEDPQNAAVREVFEETGVKAEPVKYIEDIFYPFSKQEEAVIIEKTVSFFLMLKTAPDSIAEDPDTLKTRWLNFDQAIAMLSFELEQDIVRKARQMLEKGIDDR